MREKTWKKINSSLLILSCLSMLFTPVLAQTQGQSDRIKLEKKPEETEPKSSGRLTLEAKSPDSISSLSSSRLEAFSQRLNLVRSTSMEYNQQLRIQQVGEVFAQSVRFDNKAALPKLETPIAKAERLLKQGNTAQAKEIYNKLIAENSKDYRARSAMAYILLQEGETESALKEYEEISKSYDDAETQVNYGVALYSSGRVKEATKQYEKVLENIKNNLPAVHFNLAMSYAHSGESEKAIEHYKIALKQKNNKYPEAANNLGLVYEALGDENKEAINYFKSATEIESLSTATAHYNLARQYYRNQEHEKAIREFEIAINKRPNFPEAYLCLANTLLAYGEKGQTIEKGKELLEKAIENYKKAIEKRNNIYPLAHENLAIALVKNKQKQDAFPHFRLAIEQYGEYASQTFNNLLTSLKPDDESSIFIIDNELSRLDNPGNLVFKKKISTATDTTKNPPINNLGNIELSKQILEKALETYEDIDEKLKNLADVRYCGARAYLILGNTDAAMEEIVHAARLSKYKDIKIMQTLFSLSTLRWL